VFRSPWTDKDKSNQISILEVRMRKASQPTGPTGDVSLRSVSTAAVSTALTRRRFLFALGATSVGAAAAPAVATVAQATSAPVEEAKASGYRETDHVRDYYDSARI
jgi:hypothetical protein